MQDKKTDNSSFLQTYRSELESELDNILVYWGSKTIDKKQGGFYGRIGYDGIVEHNAHKGSVLHARVLWTFSAACIHRNDHVYTTLAHEAYQYFTDYFIDREQGGVYWSIEAGGMPANTKKQIYALAFAIYGLAEYHLFCGSEEARMYAIHLFELIEQHAYDPVHGGYTEAFTKNWQPLDDLRLSAKDANEQKSMNTHLHVLEAYTLLYRIWPNEKLKQKLQNLIGYFLHHIFQPNLNHLSLFFNNQWERRSTRVSYGHDIEASWLLTEAAAVLEDAEIKEQVQQISVQLAEASVSGLDQDGGLFYEYFPEEDRMITEKHWWPQAEAMIGFFHAWQQTGEQVWLNRSQHCWSFVKNNLLDSAEGEWYWGVYPDGSVMKQEDKAGFWKCPYHNSRACIEIINRIDAHKRGVKP